MKPFKRNEGNTHIAMKKTVSPERPPTITIAAVQFGIYAVFSIIGFIMWIWSVTATLQYGYISGHLERWTAKFSIWGPIILVSGVLSLVASNLLWKSKRLGGYLGVISFAMGFATNLIIARNLFVHTLAGALAGWTLLVPLFAGWKSLKA